VLGGAACVAFVLTGRGPTSEIADAGGNAFQVRGDPGGTVEVDLTHADLELSPPLRRRRRQAKGALRTFLEERGVLLRGGLLTLGESLLADGDRVVVAGVPQAETRPDGYRGETTVRVLRGTAAAPVLVRRTP